MSGYLEKKEIIKETGVKPYTLDYLLETGRINAKRFKKGVPRKYDPDTIKKIKEIQSSKKN